MKEERGGYNHCCPVEEDEKWRQSSCRPMHHQAGRAAGGRHVRSQAGAALGPSPASAPVCEMESAMGKEAI